MIVLGVLPTVLDLFFKYEWNNFLHNLVKNLLEIIITGEVCPCLLLWQCGCCCGRVAVAAHVHGRHSLCVCLVYAPLSYCMRS